MTDDARVIVRAVLQLGRALRAQRPAGSASLPKLGILATLHRFGPMPAARLAVHERLQPQSLTRILNDLQKRALIRRRRDAADKRLRVVEITRAGQAALAHDMSARRQWLEAAMSEQLNPTERALLRLASDVMTKLAAFGTPSARAAAADAAADQDAETDAPS